MPAAIAVLIAVAVLLLLPDGHAERLRGVAGRPDPAEALSGVVRAWRQRTGGPRDRRRRSREVNAALVALASELRAGQPPTVALPQASATAWPTAISAIRLDADVVEALRIDGRHDPVLRDLAACWEVGATSGSGLADAIEQLASAHREADDVRGQLEVQLAGPRATARMLALLPLFGIALGIVLGADPLGFLLGSLPGLGCLVGGIALTLIGLWWTRRISARVEARL